MPGKPTTSPTTSSAPADRFDGMIGPSQILAWVASSCPFLDLLPAPEASDQRLATLAAGSNGWLKILQAGRRLIGVRPSPESRLDYLALCLAAHHATVGSYVPTDVDSKIRGELWRKASGPLLRDRWELAKQAHQWSPESVSSRVEHTAVGPLSGHDGEWLGVAVGALGAALLVGDTAISDEIFAWIDGELTREVTAYTHAEAATVAAPVATPVATAAAKAATRKSAPSSKNINADALAVSLARLAWILTHNAGDVDQGLSYWPVDPRLTAARTHLTELAHAHPQRSPRYSGVFIRAKAVYQLIAAEGHRNYPLRAVKSLRTSADLLLPLGPCLEAWGARVAASPVINDHDRAEVLATLLDGITKVKGQVGYHRAIVGLASVRGGLPALCKRLKTSEVRMLDDLAVRKQLTISADAFAASLAKRIRAEIPPATVR